MPYQHQPTIALMPGLTLTDLTSWPDGLFYPGLEIRGIDQASRPVRILLDREYILRLYNYIAPMVDAMGKGV